jgi:alkylation response protein AidB-like acyl-CoA dehydrogenase
MSNTVATTVSEEVADGDRFASVADPVERARMLAPAISAAAEATEANGTMLPAIVDQVKQAELFWTLVPTEVGGLGADILTALRVTEELSRADGSTGWSVMANMSVTGFTGGWGTDAAVKTLFQGDQRSVIAGMFAPMGKVEAVEGGYRARGTYSFGSGTGHADWIGGGAKAQDENGDYELIYLVPRDQMIFQGGWSVLGLEGTGSYDYEIPEQFVSEDFALRRVGGAMRRGQATQALGLQIMGSSGHAGVAMGIARRALEELYQVLSNGKTRPGVAPIIDQQLFQHEFATAEAKFASARAYCFEVFGNALNTVQGGDPYTELEYQRIRQASTWITRVAMETVEFAYTWSGSKGLREPSPLARCLRDMHAATQHVYIDPTTMVYAAPVVFGSYAAR